jgi:hypothetical protein
MGPAAARNARKGGLKAFHPEIPEVAALQKSGLKQFRCFATPGSAKAKALPRDGPVYS